MINYQTDRYALIERGGQEHELYMANAPFPHIVVDLIPPIFRKTTRAIKRAIKGEKLTELWN
jgi:hypothetical protein